MQYSESLVSYLEREQIRIMEEIVIQRENKLELLLYTPQQYCTIAQYVSRGWKMNLTCSVNGCENNRRDPNITIFYATTSDIVKLWTKHNPLGWKNASQIQMCSAHFCSNQMSVGSDGKNRLLCKRFSVPSIFFKSSSR